MHFAEHIAAVIRSQVPQSYRANKTQLPAQLLCRFPQVQFPQVAPVRTQISRLHLLQCRVDPHLIGTRLATRSAAHYSALCLLQGTQGSRINQKRKLKDLQEHRQTKKRSQVARSNWIL